MTSRDFQAVVSAIDAGTALPPSDIPETQKVAVLGACADAQTLAAAFLAGGAEVRLYSPYESDVRDLRQSGGITVRGEGPVGTFSVDPRSDVHIVLAGGVDEAVDGADLVFVVGTVAFQRAMGILMAGLLSADQIAIAAPGRTFGALELAWSLRSGGVSSETTVVEMQGLPWRATASGPTAVSLVSAPNTRVASLPSHRAAGVATALSRYLPTVDYSPTVLHTSLTDASGMNEVPAMIMGGPGLEAEPDALPPGAGAIEGEKTRPTSAPLAKLIVHLAAERRAVAQRWGVRDVPSDEDWLAPALDPDDSAAIPTGNEARQSILDRTAGSFVPLSSAGRLARVETPVTDAVITSISAMFDFDLAAGRRLEYLGFDGADLDDVRRAIGSRRPNQTTGDI